MPNIAVSSLASELCCTPEMQQNPRKCPCWMKPFALVYQITQDTRSVDCHCRSQTVQSMFSHARP